ncbi:MAG: DUF4124 domain-containing protein [Gammaproteobacteria bacterium]|nr:MAG: DUF4124 domain-containing protein [Gammaproteobacteria bacterium]
MHRTTQQFVFAIAMLIAAASLTAEGLRTYRWVDDAGVTHYGDRVPPQYAGSELSVLNEQGVTVNTVEGTKTPEQIAKEGRARELRAEQIRKRDAALLRDRVLLSTYLSVEEIEDLRDRRMELVDGQMRVIQIYLANLREKLVKLEKESQRFSPYSSDPNARPIDEKLARELSDTLDSIMLYEKNLAKTRTEQKTLVSKFAGDITRFQDLHSLN